MTDLRERENKTCIQTIEDKKGFDMRSTFKALMLKPVFNFIHLISFERDQFSDFTTEDFDPWSWGVPDLGIFL